MVHIPPLLSLWLMAKCPALWPGLFFVYSSIIACGVG
jgi:hypothetical protein